MTPRALVLAALALAVAAPGPARAQEPEAPPRPTGSVAGTGGWGAVDLAPRRASTVVAVTMVFPRGSASDPAGAPGAAWLLAHVAREVALAGLDPAARAATQIAVDVDRSRSAFRMVTLPRHWEEAYGVLEWAVLRAVPPQQATARVRAEMQEVFRFERDAPHREFETLMYRMLSGSGSAWSRPPRGTAATVDGLSDDALPSLRDGLFRKEEGVVTVVGAIGPREAARTVVGDLPSAAGTLPEGGLTAPGFTPLGDRAGDSEAWESGGRAVVTREVTSTWLGIAFPVDPETPATALEMLLHRLDGEFNSTPPDPGSFGVEVRLELLGSGELLVVEAAVLPDAADEWEARIRSAVESIAADEIEGPYFRAYRRRFRAARLLEDAPPEVAGWRRALDLLERGRVRELAAEITDLDADDLQEAADDLGEPRLLVFGPDLSEGSSR